MENIHIGNIRYKEILKGGSIDISQGEFVLVCGKTGSGKTVMGMSVIFHIQKPTLILVEKVKLLEQWKEKIKDFMNFEPGVYYGAKQRADYTKAKIEKMKEQMKK